MTTKNLIVQRKNLYDIVEIVTDNLNSHQFTSLKKFHTGGCKKIINRTYFADKSSIFTSVTLNNENIPIEALFDINTYKQSKKSINGTYRIEYFTIGSLNGEPCIIVSVSFISRKGIIKKINNINLTGADIPQTIEDLDMLLSRFAEIICGLSNRFYSQELFKVSTIYPLLELLEIEKGTLNNDEQAIMEEILASLTYMPLAPTQVK